MAEVMRLSVGEMLTRGNIGWEMRFVSIKPYNPQCINAILDVLDKFSINKCSEAYFYDVGWREARKNLADDHNLDVRVANPNREQLNNLLESHALGHLDFVRKEGDIDEKWRLFVYVWGDGSVLYDIGVNHNDLFNKELLGRERTLVKFSEFRALFKEVCFNDSFLFGSLAPELIPNPLSLKELVGGILPFYCGFLSDTLLKELNLRKEILPLLQGSMYEERAGKGVYFSWSDDPNEEEASNSEERFKEYITNIPAEKLARLLKILGN
jgi:hypothetical protein